MSSGTLRLPDAAVGLLRRREVVYGALLGVAVATFLLRYELLLEVPYPPSGDAGGDLYLAHAWLGHGLAQLPQSLQTPPLYFFVIVAPFTTVFPTFEGIRLYMAFVPALLVLPGYLFVRQSGVGRWSAVLGATLLAQSTIWSLMVTWNAGFNLFGIFLLLFFLVALARFLRSPTLRSSLPVAATLLLVGLAHPLTFLVAAAVLATAVVIRLSERPSGAFRQLATLLVPSVLACLPLLIFYVPSSQAVSTSGGGGSYASEVFWAFQNGPYFAWGYQGATVDAVVVLDLALSLAALSALARRPGARPFVVPLAGVLVAAVVVVLLDPANAVRALYFLPLPFLAPLPALFDRWYRDGEPLLRRLLTPALRDLGATVPPRMRAAPPSLRAVFLTGFAVVVVLLNANVSAEVMSSGVHFNESLRPDAVATMDWIRTHTPRNATFIDGAGLQPWMWGYAERMDYAPAPAGIEVTSRSESDALASEFIDLGSFLLANPYWVVASSFPSPVGTPQIYLATPGYFEPFLGSEASSDHLELSGPSGTRWVGLQYAALDQATGTVDGPNVSYRFALDWRALGETVVVTNRLDGSDLSVGWSAGNVSVDQVNYTFGMPPSGYFFSYDSVPQADNATSLTDRFSLGGVPFTVHFSGGRFTQRPAAGGWTQLWYWGQGPLTVSTSGMRPQNHLTPAAMATSALVRSLGIDHAVVDVNRDFGMYDRLRAGVFWDGPAVLEFQSGPMVVFGR